MDIVQLSKQGFNECFSTSLCLVLVFSSDIQVSMVMKSESASPPISFHLPSSQTADWGEIHLPLEKTVRDEVSGAGGK